MHTLIVRIINDMFHQGFQISHPMKKIVAGLLLIACAELNSQVLTEKGTTAETGRIQLPWDRLIQPAGTQILFGDASLENHAMDAALSPDGKWLAVEERYSIVFISTSDNSKRIILRNNESPELRGGMNTYSGIIWHKSTEGPEVYWGNVSELDRSYVVSAKFNGTKAEFGRYLEYRAIPPSQVALPNEILITNESGHEYLYVVLNGNNRIIKQDLLTGNILWAVDPGVAPYGIVMAAGKLYVTNWAGRHPDDNDRDVAGAPWEDARVDNLKAGGATREGSVTVIDPSNGRILKEIITGLHPNDIVANRKGEFVYLTNSNSDNISVINTKTDEISETISVRLQPEINPYFGDSPNGLCLSFDEQSLFVANGMDNAVAVIRLKDTGLPGKSTIKKSYVSGFIPTGAYPSAVTVSGRGIMYVCNLEAEGARSGLPFSRTKNLIYNSHDMQASVSVIPLPGEKMLKAYTDTVVALNNISRALKARQQPRESVSPKPVPERIGEPSPIKHIVYIIKENRTYDQVLGDMKQGDGDPVICTYGELITPNTHKLADEFLLLDNFYVSGKCSAEGHQWTDASIVTDYIEKNVRAWFRSYPHVQADALVYAPSGFLWDNAMKGGKKVRIYGEASSPVIENNLKWADIYKKYKNGEKVDFTNKTTIESVKGILSQTYPSFGNHEFTDVMRADALIKDLHDYEAREGDQLPDLMIAALPNDHTAGIRPGSPTPRAMVADNDYALGRIVEAFTKSRFWENTAIFVVEDDSQSGWDHVSAYRTVALVISPYSRLNRTIHTYYTQPSMVRTIEQILGLPPMNIQDAIASPMSDCFSNEPDKTPYNAIPNKIPIDEMNPQLSSLSGKALHYAKKSLLPEFDGIDTGDDDLLNRILWFAAKGNVPYPAKYCGADND